MNKRAMCLFIVFILALAIIQQVDAKPKQKIYRSIEDKIDAEGSADVIIRLSSQATDSKVQKSARSAGRSLDVLRDSNVLKKEKELKIINAYSGELTKSGLRELKDLEEQGYTIEIYEDIMFYLDAVKDTDDNDIELALDNSVSSIGANYSQNILNITGRGVTVAVIDSGVDYTHPDLDGCNITTLSNNGVNQSYIIESAHNYSNDFDYTWNITNSNYSVIGLHFRNITLEYDGQENEDKDSHDRIVIYDSNMREIGVYQGVYGGIRNIWTPYSDSNTIYVRLITDSNTTAYGFYIDQIRNGTTNTTYNWSDCTRFEPGWDFVNNDGDPMDDYSHGTHVAGIIGANGVAVGVAPDVDFMALKACDSAGGCQLSDIIAAIEWATDNDADIISMSLGGSFSSVVSGNTGKDSTSLAAEAAVASGKIVVVAAGNHGPGISTLAVPGASENVITVGNIDDQGTPEQTDDIVATSSSRGPSAFGRLDPDLVAPGQAIYSTLPDNDYGSMDGTSMATPHVSGVAALMLEQNSSLTPEIVKRILMQTAANVSGKVFEVGAGEVNAINALTSNLSAIVDARNSYAQSVSTDRWEFVSPITGSEYANITIYNDNDHDINFTLLLTYFDNLENDVALESSQFTIPESIIVTANDYYVIEVNFTVDSFTELYATTYGGKLMLIGNDSKNLTIPIVVTVPILNYANLIRTMTYSGVSSGDVLYYAYYNSKAGNETIKINWNSSSNDLDLYEYNSSAYLDEFSGNSGTSSEVVTTTLSDNVKWFRIHGYDFSSSPFNFTINITDNGNIAPNITNAVNEQGQENFNFSLDRNITIIFYYSEPDNDTLTYTLNDSRYTEVESSETNSNYNSTYRLVNNASLIGNHTVRFTIQDEYGASTYRDVLVRVYDLEISSFYPTNLTIVTLKNSTINFSQTSYDPSNNTLYYYWYINSTLNATTQNLTIDTTNMPSDNYNITLRVTNNYSNVTKTWNVTIDQYGPSLTILTPNGTINNSIVPIRFNVSDPSGISSCWYKVNNTEENTTIVSCTNTTTYLLNGSYRIILYSNDSLGFIASANSTFTVVDATPPIILSTSPSGTIDYDTEVTLSVTLDENATCKYSEDNESYASMNNFFDTTGIINTKDYDVQGGESYTIYVRCMDIAGNINIGVDSINFTVEDYAPDDDGSPGGGGRTTTGGTTPADVTTPSTSSKYNTFIIESKGNITLNVNSESISLKYLFIQHLGTKRNIDMSIIQHSLDAMPSSGNLFMSNKKKYSFVEVKHINLDNTDVEAVKLRFKVLKSWINENSIVQNSIKIYRYTNAWDELSTTVYSQDSTSITFEATSPGLSYFIIAGDQQIMPSTPPPANTNEITGDQVLVKKDPTQEKPLGLNADTQENDNEAGKSPFTTTLIVIIVIAVIITIVGVDLVVVRNKKIASAANKEAQIADLKKRYMFEGSQIIQEYNTRLAMLAKDPMRQQKAMQLKQVHDQMIRQLHDKYINLINQVKTSN